jgi:tetratricopeptide (TPR) repeat protein
MSPSPNDSTYSPNSHHKSGSSFFDALLAKPIVLVSLVLGVIVIAAVFVGIRSQKQSKAQAANNAIFHAQKSYETEMKALATSVAATQAAAAPEKAKDKSKKEAATPPAPSPESVMFTKTDVDAKFPETLKNYRTVVEQFPGTRAAFEALLAMGSLYSNHGQHDKAVSWLEKAGQMAPTASDRGEAYYSLGYALEGSGKYAEAVQAYEKALKSGEPMSKADVLLAIARNQELLGDKAKARETYDQVIKQFPNTDQAHTAETLKAEK